MKKIIKQYFYSLLAAMMTPLLFLHLPGLPWSLSEMKGQSLKKFLLNGFAAALRGVVLVILSRVGGAWAEQTGGHIIYNFTGTMVQATPCAVNGDQPILVTFGNVGIKKFLSGSKKYVKDLNYSLNCGGATSSDNVTLFIKAANVEAWNWNAIASNVFGVGAEILKDSKALPLNQKIDIEDPSNPPALQVLLVSISPGVTLSEQEFTIVATMIVEYG